MITDRIIIFCLVLLLSNGSGAKSDSAAKTNNQIYEAKQSEFPARAPSPTPKSPRVKNTPEPIKRDDNFEDIILRLKRLARFVGESGRQTFYISNVEKAGNRDFVYAYWKQKPAVIVLALPVFGEPTDSELYWLSGKAYIDLTKDVVPKELGNMGCCLVTKAWAQKAVKKAKAGYKLKFSITAPSK